MKIARIFEKIEKTFTAEFGDSVVTDKKELVNYAKYYKNKIIYCNSIKFIM